MLYRIRKIFVLVMVTVHLASAVGGMRPAKYFLVKALKNADSSLFGSHINDADNLVDLYLFLGRIEVFIDEKLAAGADPLEKGSSVSRLMEMRTMLLERLMKIRTNKKVARKALENTKRRGRKFKDDYLYNV